MPRPPLNEDPHNLRRIDILKSLHNVIYHLRHLPHRRNEVRAMLKDILAEMPTAFASSMTERDSLFGRCSSNLYLMVPVSLRLLWKHNDRDTDRDVAKDLIKCIPEELRQPKLFDPEVEEPSSEEESERNNPRGHRGHHGHHGR
ncbi:uncharacterized protein N7529_005798 [Penicillium soppii]|jgi:hypothetical protein|uniref:uncharacterized protein n=1 Tax=Penicillium soppii TaxID=69789 RepID=UPI0025485C6B|nr:uncharacterized protein N7529_005798 [Penicillium soppii]KAJ5863882.1 hypothetical protein N7529_005798 [Penicillium soppii]